MLVTAYVWFSCSQNLYFSNFFILFDHYRFKSQTKQLYKILQETTCIKSFLFLHLSKMYKSLTNNKHLKRLSKLIINRVFLVFPIWKQRSQYLRNLYSLIIDDNEFFLSWWKIIYKFINKDYRFRIIKIYIVQILICI